MPTSELLLKDVVEIKEDVHASDFNVLVDLSGALQRERTGLKLAQELLRRRRVHPPAADGLEPDYSMSTSLAPSRRRAARSSAHFKAQARRAVMAASSRP